MRQASEAPSRNAPSISKNVCTSKIVIRPYSLSKTAQPQRSVFDPSAADPSDDETDGKRGCQIPEQLYDQVVHRAVPTFDPD
jgi:hypothetical protein